MRVFDDIGCQVILSLSERQEIQLLISTNSVDAIAHFSFNRHGQNEFFRLVEEFKKEIAPEKSDAQSKPNNALNP